MESLKAAKTLLNRQPLSEFLPYMAYHEEKELYFLDNGVGFIFECEPLAFAGEDTARTMRGLLEGLLPHPGVSIQFMLYASPYIEPGLNGYAILREAAGGASVFTDMARKRGQFYLEGTRESLFKGYDIRIRNFRLLCSVLTPAPANPDAYEKSLDPVSTLRDTVRQTLGTAHLTPRNLAPARLINLLSELLNPSRRDIFGQLQYDASLPLKDQIIFASTDITVEEGYLILGGKYCKCYTIKQYPEEWDIARCGHFPGDLMENVRQIGVPFLMTANCEAPDAIKAMADLQKKAAAAGYQAFGPLGKFFPRLAMKKQNFDNMMSTLENGEKLFYAYHSIVTYSDSLKEAAEVEGVLTSLFRSMNFIIQEDTYIMLPLFLMSLPCGYLKSAQRDLRRRKTFTTGNVSELLPLQADWKGSGDPVIPLISRRGQLQFLDVFHNPTGGFSCAVAASTGAGKSFFINELAMSYLGVGARVWTIDIGRSYEKLCHMVDGEFVVFSRDSKVCLNPFSDVADLNEEMPLLKSVVAQMASSREPLDDLRLSYIEEAIGDCFAGKGKNMTITDVAEYLRRQKDSRQWDLARMLYSYTAQGSYASYFEGESQLAPSQRYVVLELEELKSKKDLQEVVLLTLIYQIQQEIIRDRSERKLVIIDEAWDLLTGGNTTNFIENGYRRFRKYRGACISITQSVNDFYKNASGRAIIENSDFLFLLRQKAESIEALKESKRISLSEGLYNLLKSVHTDVGSYSEIFVYGPTGITIGRLLVDRFTQLLYTTRAEEYEKIKELTDGGMSVREAIEEIIREETLAYEKEVGK